MKEYYLVIPAAGRGIRALEFTGFGGCPKPFISVGGKTVFGLIMDEALHSGIRQLGFIVDSEEAARPYQHYFDPFRDAPELEAAVAAKDEEILARIRAYQVMEVEYLYQENPLGFGHAVGLAYPQVKGAGYAGVVVALGDDLICGGAPGMQQMIEMHRQRKGMIITLEEVDRESARRFGVAQVKGRLPLPHSCSCRDVFEVSRVVEKPEEPQPNFLDGQDRYFAVAGRYLLEEEDLRFLYESQPPAGQELDFSPLFERACAKGRLTAILPQGNFHTVGNALDVQKAAISLALDPYRQGQQSELIRHTLRELVRLGVLLPHEGSWQVSKGPLSSL